MIRFELKDGTNVYCDDLPGVPLDMYCTDKDMYIYNKDMQETYFYGYEKKYILQPLRNENWIEATDHDETIMKKLDVDDPKYCFVQRIIIE